METINVGDFLVSQWGYGQTNITFFKVLNRTKATLTIQEWEQEIVKDKDAGYLAEYVKIGNAPKSGQDGYGNYGISKPIRRKIKVAKNQRWQDDTITEWEYVTVKSWGMYASKTDPTLEYLQTHYH